MTGWTQPICTDCWVAREGDQEPVRLRDPHSERCCLCGATTARPIYIRIDPASVTFPRDKEN